MTLGQTPEGNERGRHENVLGKNIPGRGSSKARGSIAGLPEEEQGVSKERVGKSRSRRGGWDMRGCGGRPDSRARELVWVFGVSITLGWI